MILSAPLFCESVAEKFPQRIEWNADDNALRYEVEIQSAENGKSQKVETNENFLELSLEPGVYRFRVFVYDFLERSSNVTGWTEFSVFKAAVPEILNLPSEIDVREDGFLSLNIVVNNVTGKTRAELVNSSTKDRVRGLLVLQAPSADESEIDTAMRAEFNSVLPGKYTLLVTNPSGLFTESSSINIKPHKTKADIREEERIARKKIREERGRPDWYKPGDFSIMAGTGIAFAPYDGTVLEYTDWRPIIPEARLKLMWLPWQPEGFRFGFEADCFVGFFSLENQYLEASLLLISPRVKLTAQRRIFIDGLFISFTTGAGITMFRKEVEFTTNDNPRRSPEKKLFGAACVSTSISVHYNPTKGLALESGVEFMHVFAKSMPTGVIDPYVMIGARF